MATTAAFKSALGRCGLNDVQQDKVTVEGVDTISDLAMISKDEMNTLIKHLRGSTTETVEGEGDDRVVITNPVITMVQGRKLLGFYAWAVCHDIMKGDLTAGGFAGNPQSRDARIEQSLLRHSTEYIEITHFDS
jgi:hypothetical protein